MRVALSLDMRTFNVGDKVWHRYARKIFTVVREAEPLAFDVGTGPDRRIEHVPAYDLETNPETWWDSESLMRVRADDLCYPEGKDI